MKLLLKVAHQIFQHYHLQKQIQTFVSKCVYNSY